MIKAYSKSFPEGIRVHGVCNKGGWFGETYLLELLLGCTSVRLVVEGEEHEVLNWYADSKWAKFTELSEQDAKEYGDDILYLGNYCKPHHIEMDCRIEKCKVDYFAKKED